MAAVDRNGQRFYGIPWRDLRQTFFHRTFFEGQTKGIWRSRQTRKQAQRVACSMLGALSPLVTGACEPWCAEPCIELSGDDLGMECGSCSPGWACNPLAAGFRQKMTEPDDSSSKPSVDDLLYERVQRVFRGLFVQWNHTHPLHYAAAAGWDDTVETLLRDGANPMAKDSLGWTALRHALMASDPRERSQRVVQQLLDALPRGPAAGAALNDAPHGLTLLDAAAGVGNVGAVHRLLELARKGGHAVPVSLALEAARSRGAPARVVQLLEEHAKAGLARREEETDLQRGATCPHNGTTEWRRPSVLELTADELSSDEMGWRGRVYAAHTPAIVHGLARTWSDPIAHWTPADFRASWGDAIVKVCYSPTPWINRIVDDGTGGPWMRSHSCNEAPFRTFVDELPHSGVVQADGSLEHVLISQSQQATLREFRLQLPLPETPPGLHLTEDELATLTRNLWVSTPPQTSVLHSDTLNNLLLQLQGTKRLTLLCPHELDGWTMYLANMPKMEVRRPAGPPGRFFRIISDLNFERKPLVNVSAPDFARFPLFRRARVAQLELKAGDALMLPLGWQHEIQAVPDDSAALNIAISYWWVGRRSEATILHTLAARSELDCTQHVAPGPAQSAADAADAADADGGTAGAVVPHSPACDRTGTPQENFERMTERAINHLNAQARSSVPHT